MRKKAKWHLNINGGLIPLLEMPNGEIINESNILMEFAEDFGSNSEGI